MAVAGLHHHHEHAARRKVAATYAALGGLSALVVVRDPLQHQIFPPCPLHATTGLFCPGCGATRASALLLRGHLADALHYNLLWVVAAPFVVYRLLVWGLEAFGVHRLPRLPSNRLVIGGILGAIAAFFIVRNLPGVDALNPLTGA